MGLDEEDDDEWEDLSGDEEIVEEDDRAVEEEVDEGIDGINTADDSGEIDPFFVMLGSHGPNLYIHFYLSHPSDLKKRVLLNKLHFKASLLTESISTDKMCHHSLIIFQSKCQSMMFLPSSSLFKLLLFILTFCVRIIESNSPWNIQ